MNLWKRILRIVFAVVILLTVFSGCSKAPAGEESTAGNESVADTEPAAVFALSADDIARLGTMEKNTIEYLKTWFAMMLPEENIELVNYGTDDTLYIYLGSLELLGLEAVVVPKIDDPDYYADFSIQFYGRRFATA